MVRLSPNFFYTTHIGKEDTFFFAKSLNITFRLLRVEIHEDDSSRDDTVEGSSDANVFVSV
jgi:hypothetical protein